MKEVGLIIDLYQSPIQKESAVKKSVLDFYSPLIKLLKSRKEISVSLNIPLSTLDLWDKYGFGSLISDLSDLYQNDRVEVLGSSPYGMILSNIPEKIIEEQVVLNEYALGYYLGSRQGFEGEPSIMIRDVEGFLPPLMLGDESVENVLENLGYKWMVVRDKEYKDILSPIFSVEGRDVLFVKVSENLNESIKDTNNFNLNVESEKIIRDGADNPNIIDFLNKRKSTIKDGMIYSLGHFDSVINGDIDYRKTFNKIDQLFNTIEKLGFNISTVRSQIKKAKNSEKKEKEKINEKNNGPEKNPRLLTPKQMSYVNDVYNYMSKELAPRTNKSKSDEYSLIKLWNAENTDGNYDTNLLIYNHLLTLLSTLIPFIQYINYESYTNEFVMNINKEQIKEELDKLLSSNVISNFRESDIKSTVDIFHMLVENLDR